MKLYEIFESDIKFDDIKNLKVKNIPKYFFDKIK